MHEEDKTTIQYPFELIYLVERLHWGCVHWKCEGEKEDDAASKKVQCQFESIELHAFKAIDGYELARCISLQRKSHRGYHLQPCDLKNDRKITTASEAIIK